MTSNGKAKNEKTKTNNKNGQLMMSNLIIFVPFVTFFQINSKKSGFYCHFKNWFIGYFCVGIVKIFKSRFIFFAELFLKTKR